MSGINGTLENGNGVNQRLGLNGALGRWGQFGAVGIIAALLFWKVVFDDPAARREAKEIAREAHQQFLEEQRLQRDHDTRRTERLYQAIRERSQ